MCRLYQADPADRSCCIVCQAVEPTEHKQGTVPPAQEKAGYVADSET